VELVVVDGGAPSSQVARQVGGLVGHDLVDAVTGWHISAVREALVPAIAGRVPYVYTSLYEGGEHRPGVFCSGETPADQIAPALRWLRDQFGLRRWAIVGNDYVWPRRSSVAVRRYVSALDLALVDEQYLPLGAADVDAAVDQVARSAADAVLMMLVGQDAVAFNRAFAVRGLQERIVRFSPLMEENVLLASGPDATKDLYVAASYFRSLTTRCRASAGRPRPATGAPRYGRRGRLRRAHHDLSGARSTTRHLAGVRSHGARSAGRAGRVALRSDRPDRRFT
jgi:urea transport system substrate-binding protein